MNDGECISYQYYYDIVKAKASKYPKGSIHAGCICLDIITTEGTHRMMLVKPEQAKDVEFINTIETTTD